MRCEPSASLTRTGARRDDRAATEPPNCSPGSSTCTRNPSICRWTASIGCSPRSAIRIRRCRRRSMSPAPTARARSSPSCAPSSKRRVCACTSSPRRICAASTSASCWRARAAPSRSASAALQDVLTRAEAANAGQPITFFEITTAAAFLAFAEHPADIVLLETGLGGRLDATNVLDRPKLTAITPDLDRPHRLSRRDDRSHCGRKGRHPEVRLALHRFAPARRSRSASSRCGPARPRAADHRGRAMGRL